MTKLAEPFTPRWMEQIRNDTSLRGKPITVPGAKGLSFRVHADGGISFDVRATVSINGVSKRYSVTLDDTYDAKAFTLEDAREAANALKRDWKKNGIVPVTDAETFEQFIETFKRACLSNDKLAKSKRSKKGGGLADDWGDQEKKIKKMLAPLMQTPITRITRKAILECKVNHIHDIAKAKGKALDPNAPLDDRPLRQAFVQIIRILTYAYRLDLIQHKETVGLECDTYDGRLRFLLPGELQRLFPVFDKLPNENGLLLRFLLLTGVRIDNALTMRFDAVTKRELDLPNGGTCPSLIWRVTVKRGKASLLVLVGEAMRIVEHFRKQRDESGDERATVFTPEIISLWKNSASVKQREIEEAAGGLARFHRHDFGRRTLATYFRYVDARQGHVSMALTHTTGGGKAQSDGPQAAAVTEVYTINDSLGASPTDNSYVKTFDSGESIEVVLAHLRVQELFRQIERGELSPTLKRIAQTLAMGPNCEAMMKAHKVDAALIDIVEAKKKPK